MKIKFTDSVAGANFAYRMHQVVDLRPDIAKEFINAGQAVRYKEPAEAAKSREPAVEAAIKGAPENAASRTKRLIGALGF